MKLKLLSLLVICTIMLTGCASDGRVHNKKYLRAVAIDGSSVTMAFFTGSEQEDELLTVKANELDSAKKAAELETGQQLFTGYTELAILGDCDHLDVLKQLLKDWKVSPDCTVISSDEGGTLLRNSPAKVLEGRAEQAYKQGMAPRSDIITVLTVLLDE